MTTITTPLRGKHGSIWFFVSGKDGRPYNTTKFIQIPIKALIRTNTFSELSGNAVKLLIHLITQYWRNRFTCVPEPNSLRIDPSTKKAIGWKDSRTVKKAIDELIVSRMVEHQSKDGWINYYSLKWIKGSKIGNVRFIRLPLSVIDSGKFKKLSGNAVKLLIQRMALVCDPEAFGSMENGYLDFPYLQFKVMGWGSKDSFEKALDELLECKYLAKTLSESRYMVNEAFVWVTPYKRDLKTVKGQISPARYAITWDGYNPSRLVKLSGEDDTSLGWCLQENIARDAVNISAMMPVLDFPFRGWMDDY